MGQFTVLPDDIRDSLELVRKPSRFDEEITALLAGKTIFVTDPPARQTASSLRSVIRDRAPSKKLVTRTTTIGGQYGVALWVVDRAIVFLPDERTVA